MEILLELLLTLVGEFFGDVLIHVFTETRRVGRALALLGHAALGAALGAGSLVFAPAHLIASPGLRAMNLGLTPVVAGLLMMWIGATRRRREKRVVGLEHFTPGFVCALAFAVVRYFFAA